MHAFEELLIEVPALAGLAPAQRALMADCAVDCAFAAGEYLMREGEPANTFFVIRHGAVALETFIPTLGPTTIETLHEHDLLGWSWLVPPHVTAFDARALEPLSALAFNGACLRERCAQDPVLGYALLGRFIAVIAERLQTTRMRLLDLYGTPDA